MRLFSFSEIIAKRLPSVASVINAAEKYYAHLDGVTAIELVADHSELVLHYAEKIICQQGLDLVIDDLCLQIASGEKELADYIKQLFVGAIAYHDLGKLNPNFQVEKMKNNLFSRVELSIGSQHSVLSSYLYLHFFAQEINGDKSFSKEAKLLLFGIVHLFCYPIARHHSSIIENSTNFSTELFDELSRFKKDCHISLPEIASQNLLKESEKWIRNLGDSKSFVLFALLKLNYSLLTACDYYATNEYMADIKVNDFGIIDEGLRKKVSHNFKTLKSYNAELFARFDAFLNKPFNELQEPGRNNLNFLRQKLNAEVISTLRNCPDSSCYYIEAPTGAGKTNLSLACISELLQIDKSLNKVFYVFPFTTLITQTYQGIRETIGLNNDEIIQLHSKAGFHTKEEVTDGEYGSEKKLHLDNLFVNYPFCVTSHVRFFDILKGNGKETNYLLHRLCNSIVVIDELQAYNPAHWDKLVFFIENYASYFNVRFIIMSATLPKIDALSTSQVGKFVHLTPNKGDYFFNKNFGGRIEFDFSLLERERPDKESKEEYLKGLARFMKQEAETYFKQSQHSRVLVEFITKNTASHFLRLLKESDDFAGFKLFILSGDILEPQRKLIIKAVKDDVYDKVIVVSTQVVEAGVDIDMDLGFKDRSLLDSDEQLAGRINRNASKKGCKVFLFDCDSATTIYGKDQRYRHQQKDEEIYSGFKEILRNKTFDKLYEKVFEDAKRDDWTDAGKLNNYLENFKRFDFHHINSEFQLIENNDSQSIFIPVNIAIPDEYAPEMLDKIGVLNESGDKISGERLFDIYISLIKNENADFIQRQIELKKLSGLMAQFTLSVYPTVLKEIQDLLDGEKSRYGYNYLLHWEQCYEPEVGFNLEQAKQSIFL